MNLNARWCGELSHNKIQSKCEKNCIIFLKKIDKYIFLSNGFVHPPRPPPLPRTLMHSITFMKLKPFHALLQVLECGYSELLLLFYFIFVCTTIWRWGGC
jgi:hypothetical protein